ncbi:hypothetical protein AB0E85_34840 [Streptomyces sp. NPDC029044]|uniref:hypothetical protein n=1 Tax=Streptomyces sp. NPDC029044 TaxID=3157198 RepID=UPI0033F5D0BB
MSLTDKAIAQLRELIASGALPPLSGLPQVSSTEQWLREHVESAGGSRATGGDVAPATASGVTAPR